MAKVFYSLIAIGDTPFIEANLGSSDNKYVRACRKIIKKISRNDLRRPDGMATLLSGSFAYNYIHGCDLDDDGNTILENFIFLCVTEALSYAATPSETRVAAFRFLNCIRCNFIQQFKGDLNTLSQATSSSDTASIDSSQIFQIDPKMKSDLRIFSASMKDEMTNFAVSDTFIDTNDNYHDEDDEKKQRMDQVSMNNTYSSNNDNNNNNDNDLRCKPPISGSKTYENPSGSKFDQIINTIVKVKENVNFAIEDAMERNEKLPLLQSTANGLEDDSRTFRNRSRRLNWRYCRDLYKQRCIIVFVIILIIYLLSAMICGWGWQTC